LLDIERAAASSSGWIRGKSEQAVAEHCRLWYREIVRQYLQPAMVRRVRAHQAEGHVVALLSSSTPYLATPLAEELGIEHLLVSRLVIENGRFHARRAPADLLRRRQDPLGPSASPPSTTSTSARAGSIPTR
jgi:phosphoserine phosphatase